MLRALHILLTYRCSLKCDHCYVFGSPQTAGKLTSAKVYRLLERARALPSLERIYFEGGEPFLVYPLLLRSVHIARQMGFQVGIITNGFFARTEEAARRYLQPLLRLGLDELQISNDEFHYRKTATSPAYRALTAAAKLGLPAVRVKVTPEPSLVEPPNQASDELSQPLRWVGRAAEKLEKARAGRTWESFSCCPSISLGNPERLFVGPQGNVQVCQGISIGNAWDSPLDRIVTGYKAGSHPICGPLIRNGPAGLTREYGLLPEREPGDACLLCYSTRKQLVERFPQYLAPARVYNLSP